MNGMGNPNNIKITARTTKSNLKALNPFNFTHSTALCNKFNALPLNSGNEIAFNYTHFLVNEGFSFVWANSLTSKEKDSSFTRNFFSQKAVSSNPNKSIEVHSPSFRGASFLSSDKRGVGRRNRVTGLHSKKCFVDSNLQRMNGSPFHYSFESSNPAIPLTVKEELN